AQGLPAARGCPRSEAGRCGSARGCHHERAAFGDGPRRRRARARHQPVSRATAWRGRARCPGGAHMNEPIEDVQRRLQDGVLWVTLNRPDAGNAMTVAMRNQIIEWLEHASVDYSVPAVVLTGNGEKGVCPAADLRQGADPPGGPPG